MGKILAMTGFARVSGEWRDLQWIWEVRSVNNKGLDQRFRLPSDLSYLEPLLRKRLQAALRRGSIQINLQVKSTQGAQAYKINDILLGQLLARLGDDQDKSKRDRAGKIGATLLTVPGVVTEGARNLSEGDIKARDAALLESFDALLSALITMRQKEGAGLSDVLAGQLSEMEGLVIQAANSPAHDPAHIRARFETKLKEILSVDISEERLSQEAAMLAIKADIREEFDRLSLHIAQAREVMNVGSPIGRKLDFLCQEFNRETNTICSKSNDIGLTRIGLDLKNIIEQFREQVANVE